MIWNEQIRTMEGGILILDKCPAFLWLFSRDDSFFKLAAFLLTAQYGVHSS